MKHPRPKPNDLPKNPKLSVCMIVRDEEKTLPRCLKSVESVADELIVVDTGSKDNTVSVANDFGAKVSYFEWCDDFAAARNESLKRATGDWILQIDADEELSRDSLSTLKKTIHNLWYILYCVKLDNGPQEIHRFAWVPRLFRNHLGLKYARPYHEMVVESAEDIIEGESRWRMGEEPNIVIRHFGYDPSSRSEKLKRGLPIIESYLERHPEDSYMWGQLANIYCGSGSVDKAESLLKRTLEINPTDPVHNAILGDLLFGKGELETAAQCYRNAIEGSPMLGEAHFGIGKVYFEQNMLGDAILHFRKALEINPDFAPAHCALGWALVNAGMLDNGIEGLREALILNPKLIDAHVNLGSAYDRKGMLDEALTSFREALRIDSKDKDALFNLAIIYHKQGNRKEAVLHLNKARRLGVKIEPGLLRLIKGHGR